MRKYLIATLLGLSLTQPTFAKPADLQQQWQEIQQLIDQNRVDEAVQKLEILAKSGNPQAQFALFEYFAFEKPDDKKALHWLQQAAPNGDADAQYYLGLAYRDGRLGLNVDSKKAVEWFKKAAEQGHSSAQHDLGARYLKGDGVAYDLNEAVKWFQRSAAQENVYGLNKMALHYLGGLGVEKDEQKAKAYYQRSCELGFAPSCEALDILIKQKK